jgi:hypothetical protein
MTYIYERQDEGNDFFILQQSEHVVCPRPFMDVGYVNVGLRHFALQKNSISSRL